MASTVLQSGSIENLPPGQGVRHPGSAAATSRAPENFADLLFRRAAGRWAAVAEGGLQSAQAGATSASARGVALRSISGETGLSDGKAAMDAGVQLPADVAAGGSAKISTEGGAAGAKLLPATAEPAASTVSGASGLDPGCRVASGIAPGLNFAIAGKVSAGACKGHEALKSERSPDTGHEPKRFLRNHASRKKQAVPNSSTQQNSGVVLAGAAPALPLSAWQVHLSVTNPSGAINSAFSLAKGVQTPPEAPGSPNTGIPMPGKAGPEATHSSAAVQPDLPAAGTGESHSASGMAELTATGSQHRESARADHDVSDSIGLALESLHRDHRGSVLEGISSPAASRFQSQQGNADIAWPSAPVSHPASATSGTAQTQNSTASGDLQSRLGNPFEHLDTGAAPRLLEHAPHQLSVGVTDPGLGWIEIHARSGAGQISAVVTASSAGAHSQLAAQLPDAMSFLSREHVRVDHLASEAQTASQEGRGGASGEQHARQPRPVRPNDRVFNSSAEPAEMSRLTYINIRV